MALVNLETYYAFPNLSNENNLFRFSPGFVEVGSDDYHRDKDSGLTYAFLKALMIRLISQKQLKTQ